ncbi:MAG: SCO family protein, partial [Polaribacter sp.]
MNKKKYSYVGIAFIILLFGIYVVRNLDRRIKDNDLVQKDKLNTANKKPTEKNGLFVFKKVPNFEFINQDKKTITNESYKGKVYVVEFFFTTCPSICPIMNQKMLTIQEEFKGNPNFGIASISITPDIDTPEKLKKYAKNEGITHKNWNLLTGKSQEEVFALANKGFNLFA